MSTSQNRPQQSAIGQLNMQMDGAGTPDMARMIKQVHGQSFLSDN